MNKKINENSVYTRSIIIILGIILLCYGNKTNHPSINGFIVDDFVAKNKSKLMSKFNNYDFNFNQLELKGEYISEPGLFNPSQIMNGYTGDRTLGGYNTTYTEVARNLSPKKWIMHGGFSADEPELPAGLRHFYDPTQPKGSRYLDDIANSKLIGWAQKQLTNPKTDGVDWALRTKGSFGVSEHIYTWENGKKYIKGALETANPDTRKRYMAKAWRSLGETLHMIADNGCPPHVRNDSHPPGNTAPYEEFLAVKSLSPFKNGRIPTAVRTNLREAKTARDIAHQMAVFTNENFFSNETISGTDWKGITIKQSAHPNHVYKAPKLQNMDYDDGYYHKKIAGQDILLCSDKWYFSKFNISRSIPIIDEKCTDSQAKVLIPVIKEAGVNVMKLFIPELKIELSEVNNDGTIKGKVLHIPDNEYKTEIKYTGKVKIKDKFNKVLNEIDCIDGKFEGTSSKISNNKEGVYAEIEFGGVIVRSEPSAKEMIVTDGALYIKFNGIYQVTNKDGTNKIKKSDEIMGNISSDNYKISGNTITCIDNFSPTGEINNTSISVTFDNINTPTKILNFSYKNKSDDLLGNSVKSASCIEVPFSLKKQKLLHGMILDFNFKGNISKYFKSFSHSYTDPELTKYNLLSLTPDGEIYFEITLTNK